MFFDNSESRMVADRDSRKTIQSVNRKPKISLTDQTSVRKDLARRKEIKYAITGADVTKLRAHLAVNGRRQIHNDEVSTVRSIYFDCPRFSAARANINGDGSRRKLRLRWYDTPLPENDAYLEIKWREGVVTGKHRMQVQSELSLQTLSYRELFAEFNRAVPEKYLSILHRYDNPVQIVEYKREHFTCENGRLRLTLDYDLTFYDQVGRLSMAARFPCRLEDLAVVEAKIPVGCDAEVRQMLYPFTPRVNRCSKYLHGCRLLGHLDGVG